MTRLSYDFRGMGGESGISGSFGSEDVITREQIAAVLTRFIEATAG